MAKIEVTPTLNLGKDTNEQVKEAFGEKQFPLKVTFTNNLPIRVVIPEIKLMLNHVSAKDGKTATVTVDSFDQLQRATSDLMQLSSLNKAEKAAEFDEASADQDPTKNIFSAILKDTKGTVTDLPEITCKAALAPKGKISVTLTGENLKKHFNAQNKEGFWVGFAVTAPDKVDRVKFNKNYTEPLEKNVHDKKAGFALYWDNDKKQKVNCTLQWYKGGEPVGEPLVIEADSTGVKNEASEAVALKAATPIKTTAAKKVASKTTTKKV